MDDLYLVSLLMKKAVEVDKLKCEVLNVREKPIMSVCRMSVKVKKVTEIGVGY
jgi:hypothetical protein